MSVPSDKDDAFAAFMYDLILGNYAEAYEIGWDMCIEGGYRRAKQNVYSNKAYPLEHKAFNHGWQDALQIIIEYDRHWRGSRKL